MGGPGGLGSLRDDMERDRGSSKRMGRRNREREGGDPGKGALGCWEKPNCQTAMKRERGESKRGEGGHLLFLAK